MSFASTNSGMRGIGFYDSGHSPRTVDRPRQPEQPEPEPDRRTQLQKDVDYHFDLLMQKEAREREDHKRAVAAALAKQQQAQAEQQRAMKRGAYLTAELEVEQTFSVYGIRPDDQQRIETQITQLGLWARPTEAIEYAVGEAMKITASCQEVREWRIAAVKALCEPDEFKMIEDTLAKRRHQFSDEEIACGAALEIIYERLFD